MRRKEVLAGVHQTASELLEADGKCSPVLFIEDQDGDWSICGIEMTEEVKAVWPMFLPVLLRKLSAKGYIMMTEAWMATSEPGTEFSKAITEGKVRISDLPPDDRQEILMVVSVEKGVSADVLTAPIRDTPSGKRLGDLTALGPTDLGGRLLIKDW